MKRELLSLVYVLLNSRWTEKETFALYGIRKSNTTTKGKVSVAGLKWEPSERKYIQYYGAQYMKEM